MEYEIIISICSVIVAVFACIATIITAKYTRKSYITQNKGYIGVHYESYHVGNFVKKIVLKNYGNAPAKIEDINIIGKDIPEYLRKFLNAQKEKVFMPNQTSTCIILPMDYESTFKLKYSYKSMEKIEHQSLNIDLSNTNKELYTKVEYLEGKFENELLTALNQLYSKL
ncbi:MAG: hypothetical protein QP798_00255 [Staphylococcus simulans]|uniref:hypothetical protein n=1 Tax=Staphylococcus TaxID=1279 RepID=UPI0008A8D059|nr:MULTISPECIES: hypothetical protein [Staphylococcus]MDK7925709.1 hypothetical protein [Staphylococcus simulans]MDK8314366.1 hypothetical protein [Staphylococcus simulans]OHR47086.1 hypothetical protein HMPREF2951_13045 [Staphylococcus sp. HMSC056D08]OHS45185.1 hypothetical protein HMPREF3270_12650 [Staphylococcus sp. HMSC65H10]PTJ24023.1 hypothetical protein BU039_03675 [Staphylococcus simulans]